MAPLEDNISSLMRNTDITAMGHLMLISADYEILMFKEVGGYFNKL